MKMVLKPQTCLSSTNGQTQNDYSLKISTKFIALRQQKNHESTCLDKNRRKDMCTTHFEDCVIYRDYPWTTPTWKMLKVSSWQVTQWLPSSSSQNLVYLSASIKLFNSPLLLTSTLIIHPLSYGLELIYIKVAKSEIIINEMKEETYSWWQKRSQTSPIKGNWKCEWIF